MDLRPRRAPTVLGGTSGDSTDNISGVVADLLSRFWIVGGDNLVFMTCEASGVISGTLFLS